MYQGLLHLHNLLRWIILLFLLVNIIRHLTRSNQAINGSDKSWALPLLISAHITLVLGLYQYFTGGVGFARIKDLGMSAVMQNGEYRFWAIEHITGNIIAIILITLGYTTIKKGMGDATKRRKAGYLFLAALIIILMTIPWPFREGIGRPWFPGMSH